jgi:arylsulfatase A-like enzyme
VLHKSVVRNATEGPDNLTSFKFDLLAKTIDDELEPPFFGMVNTTIAHSPYDPPRPFKENATPELSRPPWYILEHLFNMEENLNRDDIRSERVYNAQTTDGIARFLADSEYLTERELEVLRAWYTASIEYLDTKLSSFLSKLDEQNALDNTILVLTADHGEYFGEHGLIAHSHYLYDEVLHVPLIITGPDVPSDRRDDLVSLVDLFDTICDLVSIQVPEETSGKSIFGDGRRDAVYSEYGIGHTDRTGHRKYMSDRQLKAFGVGRKCIRTGNYLYEYTSNGEETLYHRPSQQEVDDPDEEILTDLREQLFETLGSDFESVSDDREISDDLQENLRKLGYIE